MILVSTGGEDIKNVNEEYGRLYGELESLLELNKIENPNPHADLWEFYEYWKENLPTYANRRAYVSRIYKDVKTTPLTESKVGGCSYVSRDRIKELKDIQNKHYDLRVLISFCEELNRSFSNKSFFSSIMLVRSILNHVPPIFNSKSFNEVANNYGSKSFKDSMKNLNNSSRKIADSYLHTMIRSKEVLPTSNQVDFSNDLDVLLGEIVRVLK